MKLITGNRKKRKKTSTMTRDFSQPGIFFYIQNDFFLNLFPGNKNLQEKNFLIMFLSSTFLSNSK